MSLLPHQFWQDIRPPQAASTGSFAEAYPATLPDGRQVLLPIRILPGDGTRAVASLIINQASFTVADALADGLTDLLRPFAPDVIIGVPTLGLHLAPSVARRLAHSRIVPLGTSRKFWYDDALSEPMSSITSPNHSKILFIDPRMLPLLEGKRVAVIDDVISSGTSMAAVMRLLTKAGIEPVAIGAAMLQGNKWHAPMQKWRDRIVAPLNSPMLEKTETGWVPLA